MYASTRVHAHHVCCVHTLTHAHCYIFTYTHLHTRTTALSSAPHARYFHCAVRSGCFSLPLRARNSCLTCPRASSLPHFFRLCDAPPSSFCNRAPPCFLFLFPPSLFPRFSSSVLALATGISVSGQSHIQTYDPLYLQSDSSWHLSFFPGSAPFSSSKFCSRCFCFAGSLLLRVV